MFGLFVHRNGLQVQGFLRVSYEILTLYIRQIQPKSLSNLELLLIQQALVSIIYLGYNGIFLGAFSFAIIRNQGFKPVLTGIMPHGIIEVIAFLLFATIGFESLRYISILKLNSKSEQELTYKVEIIKLVSIFLFASILLAIAAWIESSISHV
ncbi:stage II sporulation protein M [Heyndrickxia faecalis]|uniref:stage II sporulation protein M n=1 Tax=Heyndrickxia faecalis TaxID=2824910 RepID=UPI003D1EB324